MSKKRLHLLCVSENSQIALDVADFAQMRELGWQVRAVSAASQAWRLASQNRFDLVVSEYLLPDGTVLDLLQATSVPVVVLVEEPDVDIAVACMREGAADVLVRDPGNAYLERFPSILLRALDSRRDEQLSRMLFHSIRCIRESLFVTDMDDTVIFVNDAFCRTYGYVERMIIGRSARVLWDVPGVIEESPPPPAEKIAIMGGWSGDVLNRRSDGSDFPVSLSRTVVRDDMGRNVAVVGVGQDITKRRSAEERVKASLREKEVLLKEIHHRVKNNLQVISSLLSLQSSFVKDEQTIDALRDSQNRVKSMALIHERLYQTRALSRIDFGEYLLSLVGHIKSSFRGYGDVEVRIEARGFMLDVDLVIPCGLIVNELISNSLKHGFKGGRDGTVMVRMRHGEGMNLVLTVEDNGVGIPGDVDVELPKSLGLQLVSMLAQQIHGTVDVAGNAGTMFTITFPME